MIEGCNLKKGMVLDLNGQMHVVETIHAQSPSARGGSTLYKIRTRNIENGQKADHVFKGNDKIKEGDFTKCAVEFSYVDGENYVFIDLEDYSQLELNESYLTEEKKYLQEGMEVTALVIDDSVRGITLPDTVTMLVVECAPGMRSASATSRTKPARLETGFEVQVPEYLEQGEKIKIDTRSDSFISRA